MNFDQIINRNLTGFLVGGKSYHTPLPEALNNWYCYVADSGHCLLCLLAQDAGQSDRNDYLLPVPIKSVLRGYRIDDEYILVEISGYDPETGLVVPDGDTEF